jgi:excisionase family DNA binding protein
MQIGGTVHHLPVRFEMDPVSEIFPTVVNNHISVKAAATFSGYSLQYIRRLLRSGKLTGLKIGQVWLIDKAIFDAYLERATEVIDRRFGPK